MSSKSHEMDLCSGSLGKKIFVYSVPLMFTNILQVLFNMSDVAVVGKFAGAIALVLPAFLSRYLLEFCLVLPAV